MRKSPRRSWRPKRVQPPARRPRGRRPGLRKGSETSEPLPPKFLDARVLQTARHCTVGRAKCRKASGAITVERNKTSCEPPNDMSLVSASAREHGRNGPEQDLD